MKKLIYIAFTSLFCLSLFGQAPEKMSYQAVVLNGTNGPVVSSPVGIKISILQGSVSGSSVFVETHTPTSNTNGLITLEIGAGSLVSGSFASIDWANGPYFLQTETDPLGGTNYTITGTSQLLSVPYALHAKTAESIVGGGSGGGAFTHYIGEYYGGGVIFDLWKDAQGVEHGLILDPFEIAIPNGSSWSNVTNAYADSVNYSGQFYATKLGPWNGYLNSLEIVSQPGHTNSWAALCMNSNQGGFNDWYMPAIEELVLIWDKRFTINRTLSSIPGSNTILSFKSLDDVSSSADFYYVSSSERDGSNNNFLVLYIGSGTTNNNNLIRISSETKGGTMNCPGGWNCEQYEGLDFNNNLVPFKNYTLRAIRAF